MPFLVDAAQPPRIAVVDRSPLVVSGNGFRRGERVTLTVGTGLGPRVARLRTRTGSFRVRIDLRDQPCGAAAFVLARGSAGSVARAILPAPVCIPPPRD